MNFFWKKKKEEPKQEIKKEDEKITLRKTMIDENGLTHEVEQKIEFPQKLEITKDLQISSEVVAGSNPFKLIENEKDVDLLAKAVKELEPKNEEDVYWDAMAEILMKSIAYYVLAKIPKEKQNLKICSEIIKKSKNKGENNYYSQLLNEIPSEHPAKMFYKSVEIAPDKTFETIVDILDKKLDTCLNKGEEDKKISEFEKLLESDYNPLLSLNSAEDVEKLANEIVNVREVKIEDAYIEEQVKILIKSIIYHACAVIPKEKRDLAECYVLLEKSYNLKENRYKEILEGLPLEHPARTVYKPLENVPENILKSVFNTASKKLEACLKIQGKYVSICAFCGDVTYTRYGAPGTKREIRCSKCPSKIWVSF